MPHLLGPVVGAAERPAHSRDRVEDAPLRRVVARFEVAADHAVGGGARGRVHRHCCGVPGARAAGDSVARLAAPRFEEAPVSGALCLHKEYSAVHRGAGHIAGEELGEVLAAEPGALALRLVPDVRAHAVLAEPGAPAERAISVGDAGGLGVRTAGTDGGADAAGSGGLGHGGAHGGECGGGLGGGGGLR